MNDPQPAAKPPQSSKFAGVSIVIPAYNYAHFLANAVNSALAQDGVAHEVIVVDDGSTDNTRELVEPYRARGEVVYVHQKNAGLSAARNTGIQHARYPLLMFLDADDALMPGTLRRCVETFAKLPEAFAVVGFGVTRANPAGEPIPPKQKRSAAQSPPQPREREITLSDMLIRTRFPCTAMVKKNVFDECGLFDTSLSSSEDRDMWLRIAAKRRIYWISDPLLLMRQHPNSMRRNADRMKANTRRVLLRAFQNRLFPRWKLPVWLRCISFNRYETALMYLNERRFPRALRELLISFLTWPFFSDSRDLSVPHLFRLRALAHLILNAFGHERN